MTDARATTHEYTVCGCVVFNAGSALPLVREHVSPADFDDRRLGIVYAEACKLADLDIPVDVVSIAASLEASGRLDDAGGMDGILSTARAAHAADFGNAVHHAKAVCYYSRMRRLARVCADGAAAAAKATLLDGDRPIEAMQRQLMAGFTADGGSDIEPMPVILKRAVAAARERWEHRNEDVSRGLSTGYSDLDDLLGGGFQPGELVVLGGRPSMGKSIVALSVAMGAARRRPELCQLYCSLEMRSASLATRAIASVAKIPASSLRSGMMVDGDFDRMVQAIKLMGAETSGIHVYDRAAITVEQIYAGARRTVVASGKPLGLVVVDHLQIMRGAGGQNRHREIGAITAGLYKLARDFDCAVLLVSQLNRGLEARADKRPMLSDLRESGSIEEDAATVAFVYRDEYYRKGSEDAGLIEIIVAKQREGQTGTVKLRLDLKTLRLDLVAGAAGYRNFKG